MESRIYYNRPSVRRLRHARFHLLFIIKQIEIDLRDKQKGFENPVLFNNTYKFKRFELGRKAISRNFSPLLEWGCSANFPSEEADSHNLDYKHNKGCKPY
jgi:hypothetical protein